MFKGPFLAEVFLATLELRLKTENVLPKFWARYVDDVFAVVKRTEWRNLLCILNQQYTSINFTHEEELDNKIAFLDLMLHKVGRNIEISIYHKPTSTMRYIPNDSHTPIQHKQAAFHSMVHRLVKLPLSIQHYKTEYDRIKHIAIANGYGASMIDKMIKNHLRKILRSCATTFYSQNSILNNNVELKRVCLSFSPNVTNQLKGVFKNNGMQIVYSSQNKLNNY